MWVWDPGPTALDLRGGLEGAAGYCTRLPVRTPIPKVARTA